MNSPILVDTSIFVDFFRSTGPSNAPLRTLLEEGKVKLSPFVRLEILAGMKIKERSQLGALFDALESLTIDMSLFHSAELLLPLIRSAGVNAGLIDYLIVIQALSAELPLFTRDKVMVKLARLLKVDLFE